MPIPRGVMRVTPHTDWTAFLSADRRDTSRVGPVDAVVLLLLWRLGAEEVQLSGGSEECQYA